MDRKVFTAPQRALANIVRNTRSNIQPLLSSCRRPMLEHPALAHPAEQDSIHRSLDLSFHQTIAVSHLDRQLIDNLSRNRCPHLQLS
jgi:hypothetical protein